MNRKRRDLLMVTVAPAGVLRGFGRVARGHWAARLGPGVIIVGLMYTAQGRGFGSVLRVHPNASGGMR